MNKVYIYIFVTLLLLGGGVGAYFLLSNKTQVPVNTDNQIQQTQTTTKKSLKDLLGLNSAQKCTFTGPDGSSGTVYLANGKMRGDFTSVTDSETINSHMIVDGQTSYVWMDGQNMGFQMDIDPNDSSTDIRAQGQVDINAEVEYDCTDWMANASSFSLPADVKFSDFGNFLRPTVGEKLDTDSEPSVESDDPKAAQCAACNSAAGEVRQQCLSALGCE